MNGKGINNIKNDTQIHSQIYDNLCKVYARKSDAQVMEHAWKIEAKLESKSTKCQKNETQESMRRNIVYKKVRRVGRAPHQD